MTRSILLLSSVSATLLACSEPAPDRSQQLSVQAEGNTERVGATVAGMETIEAGLAVGEQVPMAARLRSKDGETSLAKILEDGPALVVFTRSVEWCPYCQTQLKSINEIVDDLDQRGYSLYGLSYDSPTQQDRFSENQMLRYEMLSDQSSAVIDAFGLRDPQYTEGRAVGVPLASVFVIGKDGTVIAKSVSGDYRKRPTNRQVLDLVDSI